MQHELLLLLSSHPSPLLSSTLLHPGELATLHRLSDLASLQHVILSFCRRAHPTSSLSALSAILSTRVVRPYTDAVLSLEAQMLRGELGTGVPLAFVLAEMSAWEGLLVGVVRLLDVIERGPGGLEGKGKGKRVVFERAEEEDDQAVDEWTAAPLLTLLHRHSNTGLTTLSDLLDACIAAISTIWLTSFTTFLIWGRIGHEPLVAVTHSVSTSTAPTYTFPSSSLPQLPTLANVATRAALLQSLSRVCLALTVLFSLPASTKGVVQPERASTPLPLPRSLRQQLQSLLEGCAGPSDEAFSRRISSIETLLSTHLLTLHLPTHLLTHHLTLLSSTFLLRTGPFASNLISELASLRNRTTRIARATVTSLDLSGALSRAASGTRLDDEPDSGVGGGLEGFKLVLSKDEGLADDPFSSKLLGPSLSLVFTPTPAMSLFLTDECMAAYGRIWSYLMAIRNCHARLLTTWAALANSQRLRRRRRGRGTETGVEAAEASMRESAVRNVWGLVRSMLWWIETVSGHFQIDVIDPALAILLERIENAGRDRESHGRDTSRSTAGTAVGTSRPGSPDLQSQIRGTTIAETENTFGGGEGRERKSQLDFSSLTTLHTLYLSLLLSGMFLNSDVLSSKMLEMMEVCDGFCAKVERWGGDVLPSTLSSEGEGEDGAQLVWERHQVVQEIKETFEFELSDFFELLSSASTNPRRPNHPDNSISVANISTSHFFRPALPLLSGAKLSSTADPSSLQQNPVVAQARSEAELMAREFLPRILCRLDFALWFSGATDRKAEQEQRWRDQEAEELLEGLKEV